MCRRVMSKKGGLKIRNVHVQIELELPWLRVVMKEILRDMLPEIHEIW